MCHQIKDFVEHREAGKTHIYTNKPERVVSLRARRAVFHWYGKLRKVLRSPEKQGKLRQA